MLSWLLKWSITTFLGISALGSFYAAFDIIIAGIRERNKRYLGRNILAESFITSVWLFLVGITCAGFIYITWLLIK